MLGSGETETFSHPHLPVRYDAHQEYVRCVLPLKKKSSPSKKIIKGKKQGGRVCQQWLLFLLLTETTYRGKGGRVCLGSQLKGPVLPSREGLEAEAGEKLETAGHIHS